MNKQDVNVQFTKAAIKKHVGMSEDVNSFQLSIDGVVFVENEEKYSRIYDVSIMSGGGWAYCPRAKYIVTVKYGTNTTTFEFTNSIMAFINRGKPCFGTMLRCFLDDASIFTYVSHHDEWQGAQNIMDEFGYEDMIKARDVYRALFAQYNKVKALGVTEDELQYQLETGLEEYA